MSSFELKKAGLAGVQPAYVKDQEDRGLCFFTWPESEAAGAQCSSCNTVVWMNSRSHPVIGESLPSEVPASGQLYREYFAEKIERFLMSLPACPVCGSDRYDRFINNVSYPRFPDGTEFDDRNGKAEITEVDPASVDVWWLDYGG